MKHYQRFSEQVNNITRFAFCFFMKTNNSKVKYDLEEEETEDG